MTEQKVAHYKKEGAIDAAARLALDAECLASQGNIVEAERSYQ